MAAVAKCAHVKNIKQPVFKNETIDVNVYLKHTYRWNSVKFGIIMDVSMVSCIKYNVK